MNYKNKYTAMQKAVYEKLARPWLESTQNPLHNRRDPVTGDFAMCNAWEDFDRYLVDPIIDTKNKVCLDFACGPGRNLVKYNNRFKQIDGVDIAENNLNNAKIWLHHNNIQKDCNLHLCNGVDLSEISDNSYDVILSTLAFQHIAPYSIRLGYLQEFFRVLKPGGCISIQTGFGPPGPSSQAPPPVDYYFDGYVSLTNGRGDFSVSSPQQIQKDLEEIGYINFRYKIGPSGPCKGWHPEYGLHREFIYFQADKPET